MIQGKQGIYLILALFLLGGAVIWLNQDKSIEPEPEPLENTATLEPTTNATGTFANTHAIVYKSPTCGCCSGHAEAMVASGIEVEIVETDHAELLFFKEDESIPGNLWSCHTTVLSEGEREYLVEGHVPIEAIEKLVKEKPDIKGVALSGMPSGTPGMPGPKVGPYDVMTLEHEAGDEPQLYISI